MRHLVNSNPTPRELNSKALAVLIFPDLASANIATKLVAKIGGGELIGPILMGMSRPVHVLQRSATVEVGNTGLFAK